MAPPEAMSSEQERSTDDPTSPRIARVFPRRTKATPKDELAFVGGPGLFPPEVDEVHISVAFTWDLAEAERLAYEWERIAPVQIGGPADELPSVDFVPGRYLAPGYVITSRGCPNRCWFCKVWRREGDVRELPITEGRNVLDDNLLACSDDHVRKVFDMLSRQKGQIHFTGGLEAERLRDWHVEALRGLRPQQLFFAYDTPDDLEPLRDAGRRLLAAGWTRRGKQLRCYVLIGHPRDTFEAAEIRLEQALEAGFVPMAMLWRSDKGEAPDPAWRRFQREWARPALIRAYLDSDED